MGISSGTRSADCCSRSLTGSLFEPRPSSWACASSGTDFTAVGGGGGRFRSASRVRFRYGRGLFQFHSGGPCFPGRLFRSRSSTLFGSGRGVLCRCHANALSYATRLATSITRAKSPEDVNGEGGLTWDGGAPIAAALHPLRVKSPPGAEATVGPCLLNQQPRGSPALSSSWSQQLRLSC